MIQITAYLRTEEDLAKWKSIENKTEWLHNALSGANSVKRTEIKIPGVIKASEAPTPKCKGTHYMDRTNCGKPGCPWD